MSIRLKVLELIQQSQTPITSKQIAEALGVRIETVASALTDLWKTKGVKRRSIDRDNERGGRLYEYVHSNSTLEGFESLVLPLAKKTHKRKKRTEGERLAELPQATTLSPTISFPVSGKTVSFTIREARQLHEQLSSLFGHVAH
jgi:predicted transcriptional regulator